MTSTTASAAIPRAIAFVHGHGLVPAWTQARDFAGKAGRVATLPDILSARAATPASDPAWTKWFTTASSEFHGRSRSGVPIIAVRHGGGILGTVDDLVAAYAHEHRDPAGLATGGRVRAERFLRLLDGEWGPVGIVETEAYLRRRRHPFGERLTAAEALDDPLFRARAGGEAAAAAYLEAHARLAAAHDPAGGRDGPILSLDQPDDCVYAMPSSFRDMEWSYFANPPEEGASAHLLAVGSLNVTSVGSGDFRLMTETGPHAWRHGVRVVGVAQGWQAGPIEAEADYARLLAERQDLLWQTEADTPRVRFDVLTRVGDDLFTQYDKAGVSPDTEAPRNRVLSANPVGGEVEIEVEGRGPREAPCYDRGEIARRAPPGANAYLMLGEAGPGHRGDGRRLRVAFWRVVVDRSRRLLREHEARRHCDVSRAFADA